MNTFDGGTGDRSLSRNDKDAYNQARESRQLQRLTGIGKNIISNISKTIC